MRNKRRRSSAEAWRGWVDRRCGRLILQSFWLTTKLPPPAAAWSRDAGDFSYELKSLSNLALPAFHVTTDRDGGAWLIVGTESGFEAVTTIYYTQIEAILLPG